MHTAFEPMECGVYKESEGSNASWRSPCCLAELAAAKKEVAGRLQESAQFQQMKRMMMQKTKELQASRKKLQKYEPESDADLRSAEADDDEFIV